MWDERYSEPGFAYGTEPNDFLRAVAPRLHQGRALCLAEGEGRNAVFLAGLGFEVTAVDQSKVGLQKAAALAKERGVSIATQVADVTRLPLGEGAWDAIVSIWCHLPREPRAALHRACAAALRPGGAFVLEAYTPDQLRFGTGGPRDAGLLMRLADLEAELAGLTIVEAREVEREVHEGAYHTGRSAVVQLLATRPA